MPNPNANRIRVPTDPLPLPAPETDPVITSFKANQLIRLNENEPKTSEELQASYTVFAEFQGAAPGVSFVITQGVNRIAKNTVAYTVMLEQQPRKHPGLQEPNRDNFEIGSPACSLAGFRPVVDVFRLDFDKNPIEIQPT